jgi:hypothetical protein
VAEPKTRRTGASVKEFLAAVPDAQRRRDARAVATIFRRVTGAPPEMWGTAIVGYGRTRLRYASGRELDWPLVGFSPRREALVLYLGCDLSRLDRPLGRLGPHRAGKGCLYVKRLSDVDLGVLEEVVRLGVAQVEASRNEAPGT